MAMLPSISPRFSGATRRVGVLRHDGPSRLAAHLMCGRCVAALNKVDGAPKGRAGHPLESGGAIHFHVSCRVRIHIYLDTAWGRPHRAARIGGKESSN